MGFRRIAFSLAAVALAGAVATPADALNVGRVVPSAPKVVVTAGLAEQLKGDLTKPALASVHFRAGTPAQRTALLEKSGLKIAADMSPIDTYFIYGPLAAIGSLKASPLVDHLQENTDLQYFDDTADWATQTRFLQEAVGGGPYRDGSGRILDGAGIGIAIVDSGVDGSHPDLAGRMASNTRFVCVPLVETVDPPGGCYPPQGALKVAPTTNTDLLSGHGTHVAGMAAGDGTASGGLFKGTAPGAKIHGFAAGAGLHNFFASNALALMHNKFNTFSPRIRVVNNSYGGAGDHDPLDPVSLWTNKLIDDYDVVVTFAAGNDGGDGSQPLTSSYCRNPKPGVICVANYNEDFTGNRNFELDATSSRGSSSDTVLQETWPDISAPGSFVTSTCARISGVLCSSGLVVPSLAWEPYYGDAGGTSMAAPLLAGGVALLLQAAPTLTAPQVEDLLKDTAHKFVFGGNYIADVDNAGGTTSFDKGAGLLDLLAAVNDARVNAPNDGSVAHPVTIASGDGGDTIFGANDIVSATATPGTDRITFTVTVRDAANAAPALNGTLRVTQIINGVTYGRDVIVTPTGATPGASVATASRAGNVVTFSVLYSALGNPAAGDVAHNVFVSSFLGVIQDVAPGPQPGLPTDAILRPARVNYTVR